MLQKRSEIHHGLPKFTLFGRLFEPEKKRPEVYLIEGTRKFLKDKNPQTAKAFLDRLALLEKQKAIALSVGERHIVSDLRLRCDQMLPRSKGK